MSEEKTIKRWTLDYQALPVTLTVFYGDGISLNDIYKAAKEQESDISDNEVNTNWSAFVGINGPSIYLFINEDITPYLLAHESVHIVKAIFDYIGSVFDDSSEEFFAYYLGYTLEELVKACKEEFKIDIKF